MIFNSNYSLSRGVNALTESNAMQVVNEVYFGKTKEVLAIEQALHDLRTPYIKEGIDQNFNINTYTPQINSDPNKQKLQQAICDAFGFSDALINIESTATPNFGTESTSFCVDLSSKKMKNALRSTKNGFIYDKSANIVFVMSCPTGMLVDADLTDAEIIAGILHEIGHNFSPAISKGVYITSMFPAITWVSILVSKILKISMLDGDIDETLISNTILGAIMQTNAGHAVRTKTDAAIINAGKEINKKCPEILSLIGCGSAIYNIFQTAKSVINDLEGILEFPSYASIPFRAVLKMIDAILNPTGYENEKFADAFASSYGYGAELNSFLAKIRNYNYFDGGFDKCIPIFSVIKEIYMLPFTVVLRALDEHPSDAARAKHTINQLKRELANDKSLKPATKKKIQQDIKDIEALYDYHTNTMKGLPKGSDVFKLYQQTMYKILGGDIRGKFIATHVSDDIDKAYAQTRESFDVYDNKERIGIIKENTDMMKSRFKDLMDF